MKKATSYMDGTEHIEKTHSCLSRYLGTVGKRPIIMQQTD